MPDPTPAALRELSPEVLLFEGAVNSVVALAPAVQSGPRHALVLDTGLDEGHARKLLRAMQDTGLVPAAILNTHSHADHHGGNAFVLKRFPELPIYAPPLEASIIQHPILEPLYLQGAHPPAEMRGKFVLAPASPAQPLEAGRHTLGGVEVDLLPTPGHASQMYAVRLGSVLYAADALFGNAALSKHPLTFCVDSAAMKRSAASLSELRGLDWVIPGHGEPVQDVVALVSSNLAAFERVTQALRLALSPTTPQSIEDLLVSVCAQLEVTMTNPAGVLLNRTALLGHLLELLDSAQAKSVVLDNRLLYLAQSEGQL